MRAVVLTSLVLVSAAACEDERDAPGPASREALTVLNGGLSNRRFGSSLAGCGSTLLYGSTGPPWVTTSVGAVSLPTGVGYGNAVACDAEGTVLAASATTSGFIWVSVADDGGTHEVVLDAGALTNPGLSLAVRQSGQGVLVAAGAPNHCTAGCVGGFQAWLYLPKQSTVLELSNQPGLGVGEELGRGVAIGRIDGGLVVAVTAMGSPGPAIFDVTSQTLLRPDAGGFTGLTSVAFGTFTGVGSSFVVGQPGSSRAIVLDPGGPRPLTTASTIISCAPDAGLGVVVSAFDWEEDGLSDVVMSNPATNRVEVALSSRNYACESLQRPLLPMSAVASGLGTSLASVATPTGIQLAVGAPLTSQNLLPLSGIVALYELCDVPSQTWRCDGGVRPDGGAVDAGLLDGGVGLDAGTPDAGTPDAGTPDAGTPDAGTPDAGTPDAGTPDAGTPDAGGVDSGVSPDGGTPDAGRADGGPDNPPDASVDGGDEGNSSAQWVPVSCGCSAGGPALLAALAASLVRRRRR